MNSSRQTLRVLLVALVMSLSGPAPITTDAWSGQGKVSTSPDADNGRVEGMVLFRGEAPKPRRSLITKDKEVCDPNRERYKISESLIIHEGAIANAVVTVEGVPGGQPPTAPAKGYRLIQRQCGFTPHVQVAQRGAMLTVTNEDPPVKHESHGRMAGDSVFKFSQDPALTTLDSITLAKDGVIEVSCDIHGWMSAYIMVVDHSYHAVTDEKGRFMIDRIPPGTYKLRVWHESMQAKEMDVSVSPGGRIQADFAYSPDDLR